MSITTTPSTTANNNLQFVNKVLLLMLALMVFFSVQQSFASTIDYEMTKEIVVLEDAPTTVNPTTKDADKSKEDDKKNKDSETIKNHENNEINNRQMSVDIDGEMMEELDDDINEKLTIKASPSIK